MPIPTNDVSSIGRAIWEATGIMVIVVIAASLVVFVAREWLASKTGLRLLTGLLALLASFGVWIAAANLHERLVYALLGLPHKIDTASYTLTITWVDVGIFHYALLLAAIIVTWAGASMGQRRRISPA